MEWARALGIMTPKHCQALRTPSWGEMGRGAPLMPQGFVKELRQGTATGASSPFCSVRQHPRGGGTAESLRKALSLRKAEAGSFERGSQTTLLYARLSDIPLVRFSIFLFNSY